VRRPGLESAGGTSTALHRRRDAADLPLRAAPTVIHFGRSVGSLRYCFGRNLTACDKSVAPRDLGRGGHRRGTESTERLSALCGENLSSD
jgi:hypothetical protein